MAQPFDAKALAFAGKPTQAAERIAYDEANGAGVSASPSSQRFYVNTQRRAVEYCSGHRCAQLDGRSSSLTAPHQSD